MGRRTSVAAATTLGGGNDQSRATYSRDRVRSLGAGNQLGEVGKRPRQPVDLVDDDHVDLSRASASTAPPRPANQMRRAWLTIWPSRPMRIMIGSMTEAEIAALESWAADVGLKGSTEIALVEGFCDRALAAGLPLARAAVFIDTLHPIYEGRKFCAGGGGTMMTGYGYGAN